MHMDYKLQIIFSGDGNGHYCQLYSIAQQCAFMFATMHTDVDSAHAKSTDALHLPLQIMQTVVWVYSLDCYLYPFLLLGVLLIGVATSVTVLYRQRLRLAAVVAKTCLVPYVSKGYIHAMKGTQLVPGDVVVLQPGLALCDLVVLRGSCLIEDASLTGEVGHLIDQLRFA